MGIYHWEQQLMDLFLGAVVASYPYAQSVDVVLSNGTRITNAQVMVASGSNMTGQVDLPDVGGPLDETRWNLLMPFERYVRAVVSFIGNVPVCMGFILP